jgi:hypothetical protein
VLFEASNQPKEEMISPPTNEKDLFNFDNKEEKRREFHLLSFTSASSISSLNLFANPRFSRTKSFDCLQT